jgi:hypothetical protein
LFEDFDLGSQLFVLSDLLRRFPHPRFHGKNCKIIFFNPIFWGYLFPRPILYRNCLAEARDKKNLFLPAALIGMIDNYQPSLKEKAE